MSKRTTNQEIDKKLENRKIIRLGDHINNRSHNKWKCLLCKYEWTTSYNSVINNENGCPCCAGNIPLTNNSIDFRLQNKLYKRIEDVINARTPIKFQCLKCNLIWPIRPDDILNGEEGCPKCAGVLPFSNEIIDERLLNKNIKRINDVINARTNLKFRCVKCNYEWESLPDYILNKKNDNDICCPKCNKRTSPLNNDIDLQLILNERKIIRLENYKNAKTKIKWKCLQCNNIWLATPDSIINAQTGCSCCSAFKNEKIIYNLLNKYNINFEYHKNIRSFNSNYSRYIVDFYIPSLNLIIEYNGDQHYRPVRFGGISEEQALINFKKQSKRDSYINNICIDNNINILWIDGRKYKYNNLKKYILKEIF